MKVSELTGALLDYWVARAEGVSAEDLAEQKRRQQARRAGLFEAMPLSVRDLKIDYSTNWALTGPLIEKHMMDVISSDHGRHWSASTGPANMAEHGSGPTALIAICRAVVRYQFGDEVEDLP